MSETLQERLTRNYAYMIYWDGTLTLTTARENYRDNIVVYAANNFDDARLTRALNEGKITQEEYEETIAIKYPE